MIIGIGGRCRSGKTELAKVCENYGYERLYFALPLKQLCASLLDISIDALNQAKVEKTEIGLTINNDLCRLISEETDIPLNIVTEICNGVTIKDIRHMLQFIGTDLIRKYNTDWHVNKIREMINKDKNYVIDDVRFPNEKNMIEELGGQCWFIVRPTIDNISNHESETSLTWRDFGNKIIVNDVSLELFKFRWETFFENYDESVKKREEAFKSEEINKLRDAIDEPLNVLDVLELPLCLFNYTDRQFKGEDIENVSQSKDLSVVIEYKDGGLELVKNPLNIEDLKMLL
jgi:hypothetical protein